MESPGGESGIGVKGEAPWMSIELTDATTGQAFTIDDYKGKPVLIESFAVWCTTCLQ